MANFDEFFFAILPTTVGDKSPLHSLGGFGAESHVFDKFGEAQRYHFTGEEKERVSPKEATRPIVAGQQIPSWFSRLPYVSCLTTGLSGKPLAVSVAFAFLRGQSGELRSAENPRVQCGLKL